MFRMVVLASGSSGNALVVTGGGTSLLVDAGLSARQLTQRLRDAGVDPASLDGILLTHEHGDHARGLAVFCREFDIPVICNRLTGEAAGLGHAGGAGNVKYFATGSEFSVGAFTVAAFPVPHDAAEPVGFVLHDGDAALGVLTDLGCVTAVVRERLRDLHTLVVDTNYNERMLQEDTRRPWSVKQRIMSRHGHLSNGAAAEAVAEAAGHGLRQAVLGHLSRDCNTADLARREVGARLGENSPIRIEVATQESAGPAWDVGAASPEPCAPAVI